MYIKERNERLTLKEVDYWKKMFDAHLMIGTEIEVMFDKTTGYTSPSDIQDELSEINNCLRANGRGRFALETLIESVKSDGSLDNGVEIVTPGRKIYGFMNLYAQYKAIIDAIDEKDPIVSPRMGWHNHIVLQNAGYSCLELNKMIPRVIFDNLMMLCKYYYPALAFMSSTMPNEDAYTRYSQYNQVSALKGYDTMDMLCDIYETFDERYNAINILGMEFRHEKIEDFHVEFRFPDGSIFPAQMASLNILFKALVIKAIELSKYGIFDGSGKDTEPLYIFKNSPITYEDDMIEINHERDSRLSSKVTDDVIEEIRELSVELVNFLEKEIKDIDELAFVMLNELAINPVSIVYKKLCTDNYRMVNDYYNEIIDTHFLEDDAEILPLLEVIETKQITGTETLIDWCNKASELVSYKEPIEDILRKISKYRKIKFTKNIGVTIE